MTIDAVLAATIEIIERDGEAAVRIADITAATGVSHGAIYHHFVDRERLVQAAQFARLSRDPTRDIEHLGDALRGARDTVDFHIRLDALARSLCTADRAEIRRVRAAVIGSAAHRPELDVAVRDLETRGADERTALVAEAERRGLRTGHVDARAAALLLEAIAFGLVIREFVDDPPSDDELFGAMREVLRVLI